jgi:hypothetical protein
MKAAPPVSLDSPAYKRESGLTGVCSTGRCGLSGVTYIVRILPTPDSQCSLHRKVQTNFVLAKTYLYLRRCGVWTHRCRRMHQWVSIYRCGLHRQVQIPRHSLHRWVISPTFRPANAIKGTIPQKTDCGCKVLVIGKRFLLETLSNLTHSDPLLGVADTGELT